MKKIITLSIVSFILLISAFTENIVIAPLEVKPLSLGAGRIDRAEAENISSAFFDKIVAFATPAVSYKTLPQLSPASLKILSRRIISSKLEASVVCFYEKIEYLVFGTISIDTTNSTYYAVLSLYSKSQNSILRQISYSEITNSADVFLEKIAEKLNTEIQAVFKSGTAIPAGTGTEGDGTGEPGDGIDAAKKREARIFGYQIGMGYFLIFMHEWKDYLVPQFNFEQSFTFGFPLLNSGSFAMDLHLAAGFDYSFARNTPVLANVHFHSIKFRGTAAVNFKIADTFGVILGGGVYYRADVIDYQNITNVFFTDITFAPGAHGMAGIELFLNEEQTFIMGISSYFDVTFYSNMAMENIILMHARFKI